jgi:hypothetical protein
MAKIKNVSTPSGEVCSCAKLAFPPTCLRTLHHSQYVRQKPKSRTHLFRERIKYFTTWNRLLYFQSLHARC